MLASPKVKNTSEETGHDQICHVAQSFTSQGGPKDVKRLLLGTNNKDRQNDSLNCNSSQSGSIALILPSDGHVDMVLVDVQTLESAIGLAKIVLRESPCDLNTSKSLQCGKSIPDKGQNSSAAFSAKGLDSVSSSSQTSQSLDANNGRDLCNNLRHIDSSANTKEQTFAFEATPYVEGDEMSTEYNEKEADGIESSASINDEHISFNQMQNEVYCRMSFEGMEIEVSTAAETDRKPGKSLGDNLNPQKENGCSGRFKSSTDHDSSNRQKENPRDRHQSSMLRMI
ncbi:hypothetical protein Vadar_014553 [Vaccinium darrowii]|uniref:Uncharacterized protein n=1 Tax=Vaccinium darrowii TaxID=229202 RepID=A0ACB7X9R3_9ERIC|nr:hypothetical protein Vadar_014553 [Vaccinium darrowii]